MATTPDLNIDRVAKLARLALTPEEKATFAQQLGTVLHHIEELKKVDVSGVEPTAHGFPVVNVWADDVARPITDYNVANTCWDPKVKGVLLQVNSIYNGWRFEDVWLDK